MVKVQTNWATADTVPSREGFNLHNSINTDYTPRQICAIPKYGADVRKISEIVRYARLTSPEPPAVILMADGTEQVLE